MIYPALTLSLYCVDLVPIFRLLFCKNFFNSSSDFPLKSVTLTVSIGFNATYTLVCGTHICVPDITLLLIVIDFIV